MHDSRNRTSSSGGWGIRTDPPRRGRTGRALLLRLLLFACVATLSLSGIGAGVGGKAPNRIAPAWSAPSRAETLGANSPPTPASPMWKGTPGPKSTFEPSTRNSSPVGELGHYVANFSFADPMGFGYDAATHDTYLGLPTRIVVLNGSQIVGNITGGYNPAFFAYDPTNGYVYAANDGGANVTVLDGQRQVADVNVGNTPYGVVYDPVDHYVYVPNYSDGTVSVINGTSVVSTVQVGGYPIGIGCDPVSGLVYASLYGDYEVAVLNGTRDVATIATPGSPWAVAYDPADGEIYVADSDGDQVTVINGTEATANVTVGWGPMAMVYDASHHFLDVMDSYSSAVSILNGSTTVGTVGLPSAPSGPTYDGGNGLLYVPCVQSSTNPNYGVVAVLNGTRLVANITAPPSAAISSYDPARGYLMVAGAPSMSAGGVTVLSTLLGEGPVSTSPNGDPNASTDLGGSVTFNTSVTFPGAGGYEVTASFSPAVGLGCPSYVTMANGSTGPVLQMACSPTIADRYQVWFNVSDAAGHSVWSTVTYTVFGNLIVPAPAVVPGNDVTSSWANVDEIVNFTALQVSGGSGIYATYLWEGLPARSCANSSAAFEPCDFAQPTTLDLFYTVTDSNGFLGTSPALAYTINAPLTAGVVTANRSSADIGQSVSFSANTSTLPGVSVTYSWTGLPTGCLPSTMPAVNCTVSEAGTFPVELSAQNVRGQLATTPPLDFVVYPDPIVNTPSPNRTSLDVGQSVAFASAVYGGSGGYRLTWEGVVDGCSGLGSLTLTCTPTARGTIQAQLQAVDSDGVRVTSEHSAPTTVLADPQVSSPTLSAPSVTLGETFYVAVTASGGTGNFTFLWRGLPTGCASSAPSFQCVSESLGNFTIGVTVVDSNGFSVDSARETLNVSPPSSPSSSNFLGSDPVIVYGTVALLVAVAVGVGVLRLRRRRGAPEEPVAEDPDGS